MKPVCQSLPKNPFPNIGDQKGHQRLVVSAVPRLAELHGGVVLSPSFWWFHVVLAQLDGNLDRGWDVPGIMESSDLFIGFYREKNESENFLFYIRGS